MPSYYTVPQSLADKTFQDIQRGYGGLSSVYSQLFGLPENQRLTAGQTLQLNTPSGFNLGSSTEGGIISNLFQPGVSPEQQSAQAKEKQLMDLLQQGKTEAVGTIQAGKEPLKQRYDDIIASIKGKGEYEIGQAETATAREYGKRGIPLTSGVYDTALQQARLPVETAMAGSLAGVGLDEEKANQARDLAIANIQSATSRDQVQMALQLYQIAESARQQGISLEESARQFNENLAYQKSLGQETDISKGYTTLGEGSTLYNLLTGQAEYTAPKTYKPTGTSGGGLSEGDWG